MTEIELLLHVIVLIDLLPNGLKLAGTYEKS